VIGDTSRETPLTESSNAPTRSRDSSSYQGDGSSSAPSHGSAITDSMPKTMPTTPNAPKPQSTPLPSISCSKDYENLNPSQALSSAFAADLGLPTSLPVSDLTGLTDSGTSIPGTAGGNYDLTSANLVLTTPTTSTPEPGSWILIALGLASMLFAARKRFSKWEHS
jgi:hypothetical protein